MEEETSGSCYFSPVSFCISYNVWFCLFAFCYHNVSLLMWHYESRVLFSAGILFYFQSLSYSSQSFLRLSKQAVLIYRFPLVWIHSVADKHRLKRNSSFIMVASIFLRRRSPGKAEK